VFFASGLLPDLMSTKPSDLICSNLINAQYSLLPIPRHTSGFSCNDWRLEHIICGRSGDIPHCINTVKRQKGSVVFG